MVTSLDTKKSPAATSAPQAVAALDTSTHISTKTTEGTLSPSALRKDILKVAERTRAVLSTGEDKTVEVMGRMVPGSLAKTLQRYPNVDINLDAFPKAERALNVGGVISNTPQPSTPRVRENILVDNLKNTQEAVATTQHSRNLQEAAKVFKELLDAGVPVDKLESMQKLVETLGAQDPAMKKSYAHLQESKKSVERLDQELSKKQFPEAKPSGYQTIGNNKFPVYPKETLDGFVHTINGKAVIVDKETHTRIEKANQTYQAASTEYNALCESKVNELGLSEYNQKHGLLINFQEASHAEYLKTQKTALREL
jgi:hypothetical protein